ncbi:MAG TPA: DUF86 domain-containing protein [Bacteroidia bacterium]|nr:DUF86 domain-containing protein [Bacteroidia bacterium]
MKNNTIYLDHILKAIAAIETYTFDVSEDYFLNNRMIQDAVVRQFEIIGEATKRLTAEFRTKHDNVSWADMAGMRDKLIHDYIDVDIWIVWKAVKEDIPELKGQLQKFFN